MMMIAMKVLYVLTAGYTVIHHIVRGDYLLALLGPAALLFLLIPLIVRRLFKIRLPEKLFCFLLFFIFIAFELGVALRLYDAISWLDIVAHLFSGGIITLLGLCFYAVLSKKPCALGQSGTVLPVLFAFCFSQALAVLWEVYEFVGYLLTGHDAQHTLTTGVFDTMEDLICCILGSVLTALLYILSVRRKRALFPIGLAVEFEEQNGLAETQ